MSSHDSYPAPFSTTRSAPTSRRRRPGRSPRPGIDAFGDWSPTSTRSPASRSTKKASGWFEATTTGGDPDDREERTDHRTRAGQEDGAGRRAGLLVRVSDSKVPYRRSDSASRAMHASRWRPIRLPDRCGGPAFSLQVPHLGLEAGRSMAIIGPSGCGKTTSSSWLPGSSNRVRRGRVRRTSPRSDGGGGATMTWPARTAWSSGLPLLDHLDVLERPAPVPPRRGLPMPGPGRRRRS